MKTASISFVATGLAIALAAASAQACDRPGTPNGISAAPLSTTQIQVRWRNTARSDETVWWDVEMRDAAGKVLPLPPGIGRGDRGYGLPVSNVYTAPPNTKRCFRVKARTAPKTGGCVSQNWSATVCALTLAQPKPVRGLGKQAGISAVRSGANVFLVRGFGFRSSKSITIHVAGAAVKSGSISRFRGRPIVSDGHGSFTVSLTVVCAGRGSVRFTATDGLKSTKTAASARCS